MVWAFRQEQMSAEPDNARLIGGVNSFPARFDCPEHSGQRERGRGIEALAIDDWEILREVHFPLQDTAG